MAGLVTSSRQEPPGSEFARKKWRDKLVRGERLNGVGVDSSFSAAAAERAGADFMVVNNTGKFRRAGFGVVASLMPYGDANTMVLDLSGEILSGVRRTPVLAGLCAVDPFKLCRNLLQNAKNAGYAGVQNFPSVGFIDGRFRRQLERTGLGYELEVELVRLAGEMNMLCAPLVFNQEEALGMTRAGADILILHPGLEVPGEEPPDPRRAAREFREALAPSLDMRPDILVMRQSGGEPFNGAFVAELAASAPCHGFFDFSTNA